MCRKVFEWNKRAESSWCFGYIYTYISVNVPLHLGVSTMLCLFVHPHSRTTFELVYYPASFKRNNNNNNINEMAVHSFSRVTDKLPMYWRSPSRNKSGKFPGKTAHKTSSKRLWGAIYSSAFILDKDLMDAMTSVAQQKRFEVVLWMLLFGVCHYHCRWYEKD